MSPQAAKQSLCHQAETSARYGAYALPFATRMAAEFVDIDFPTFWAVLVESNATGWYAKEAVKNAWLKGRGA